MNVAINQEGNDLIKSTMNCVERMKLPPIQFKLGDIYEGEWKKGMRDGFGKKKWPDVSIYEGEWLEVKSSGRGKLIHSNGNVYNGEWKNDKANGKGTYFHLNGVKYEGEWENDVQHGKAIYEGQYFEGKKQGQAILNYADGTLYEGELLENDLHGEGIYIWPDNRVYIGQWKKVNSMAKDKLYGQMAVNILEYEEDKKNGKGVFEWSDGRKYIGTWKQGRQNGIGIYYSLNKEVKVGEWNDGIRIKWFEKNEVDQLIEEQKIKREDLLQ